MYLLGIVLLKKLIQINSYIFCNLSNAFNHLFLSS